jgi:hypothetical protein
MAFTADKSLIALNRPASTMSLISGVVSMPEQNRLIQKWQLTDFFLNWNKA